MTSFAPCGGDVTGSITFNGDGTYSQSTFSLNDQRHRDDPHQLHREQAVHRLVVRLRSARKTGTWTSSGTIFATDGGNPTPYCVKGSTLDVASNDGNDKLQFVVVATKQ